MFKKERGRRMTNEEKEKWVVNGERRLTLQASSNRLLFRFPSDNNNCRKIQTS